MMFLASLALFLFLQYSSLSDGAGAGVKYLYYLGDNRNANWSDAVAKCAEQSGSLTSDIDIDDWELLYGKSSVFLDDNYFWIGLKRDSSKSWKWLDNTDLDLDMTASFPLRPEFQDNITWDCVQWNVKEPFYVPQACDVASPFICKVENFDCAFNPQGKMVVNETMTSFSNPASVTIGLDAMPVYLTYNASKDECEAHCSSFTHADNYECWLYEYESGTNTNPCRLVISDGKPVLINIRPDTDVDLYAKYCVEVAKFTHCVDGEECICGNVTSNPTPEQLEEILEETKEKLTVPTKNLSATIRKKTSAADDRKSSITMGYFGITMITITLGGLVLLDCTSMLRDLKIMMYNLKCMTSSGRDLPPPNIVHVNLQGGPKSSYA